MFANHYNDWRKKRFDYIVKRFGVDYFNGKTLLELGAGHGHLGQMFLDIGCKVTSVEARREHVWKGKDLHPDLNWVCLDLEEDFSMLGQFDIVLNTGLLYHLTQVDIHLQSAYAVTKDLMILETEVLDNDSEVGHKVTVENTEYDSAYRGKSVKVSALYIELLCKKLGFKPEICNDPELNSEFHLYDWEILNSNETLRQIYNPLSTQKEWHVLRRFWFCFK